MKLTVYCGMVPMCRAYLFPVFVIIVLYCAVDAEIIFVTIFIIRYIIKLMLCNGESFLLQILYINMYVLECNIFLHF